MSATSLLYGAEAYEPTAGVFSAGSGNVINATIPAGGSMTNPGTADGLLVWDTGLTVADVEDRNMMVEISDITVPSGSGADIVLLCGFVYAATTTPTWASDKSSWATIVRGAGSGANTQARFGVRYNNQSITDTNPLSDHTSTRLIEYLCTNDATNARRKQILIYNYSSSSLQDPMRVTRNDDVARTHKVLAWVGVGLHATESSDQDVSFEAKFYAPGAS